MVDYKFVWSFEQTREENYRRWRQLNNEERDDFNIARSLEAEARQTFLMMEKKWRIEADQRRNERNWWRCQSNLLPTTNSA